MAVATTVTNSETLVPDDVFIYSRTDPQGRITEANQAFADLSGYTIDEMMGKPHNMIRHPDMPKEAFADMWKSLKVGRPWQGVVKNRRKDGGFYWVLATVSPVRSAEGKIIGFQSLRRRPSREQVKAAAGAYEKILRGSKSIAIEEGRVVPNHSPLVHTISRPDLHFAAGSALGLIASLAGLAFLLWGNNLALARVGAGVAFVLGMLGTALVLFRTLPHLLSDLDEIHSYLDTLLATGDFTTAFSFEQRGRSAKIARSLGLLTGWVQSTIQCIHDAVVPVEEGTEQLRLAILGIDQATNAQNIATSSVAAATTELDLTIQEVAEHLQTTESAVQETGRRAADGAAVSQRATDRIQELAAVIKSAAIEVEALGTSSAEVGAIAGVIREIADQTNLLALNASIEAARAGDAGRGFAVVANEVRSLADRTMKATAKIDALIGTIQGDSDRAIKGMRTGATQVTNGVALVQEAQGTLAGINDLMTEAVRRVSEISASSSQQTGAMNEISSNITHVAAMTAQNVDSVQQTTAMIGDLTPLIDRVKQAVAQYNV